MNDTYPKSYSSLLKKTKASGFTMASNIEIGQLLRSLVASKPDGDFLEIGTGTGLATTWLLDGMGQKAHLTSLDNEPNCLAIATAFLCDDDRLNLCCTDGNEWLKNNLEKRFDLIFADAWPGKFFLLEETLNMIKIGGFYVIDDLLPQQNWPQGHSEKVVELRAYLNMRTDFFITYVDWSTGILLMTKKQSKENA